MPLHLSAAGKTDIGQQREHNEDELYYQVFGTGQESSGLFIVADGMGGYQAGEVASQIAVNTIRDALANLFVPTSSRPTVRLGQIGPTDEGTGATGTPTQQLSDMAVYKAVEDRVADAVRSAHRAIVKYGQEHRDASGLGSTVTMALVLDGHVVIANVGDSRTYLFRNQVLKRITNDHSLVARLVDAGQITEEEVYTHPNRNLIYRSLGASHGKTSQAQADSNLADIEVDLFHEDLQPGDTLLLCSDGLWEMVRPDKLAQMLADEPDPARVCAQLVALANEHGGEDNITAVVIRAS
jgi:serine/threonine protein phosphatase PrpC